VCLAAQSAVAGAGWCACGWYPGDTTSLLACLSSKQASHTLERAGWWQQQ
jgi:hypothetical protein